MAGHVALHAAGAPGPAKPDGLLGRDTRDLCLGADSPEEQRQGNNDHREQRSHRSSSLDGSSEADVGHSRRRLGCGRSDPYGERSSASMDSRFLRNRRVPTRVGTVHDRELKI